MKMKRILCGIALIYSVMASAQKRYEKIDLVYDNASITTVIEKIEAKTSYQFYFNPAWFNENYRISGSYQNTAVPIVLQAVFDQTVFNFYITDDQKIIITQNSTIYDNLPDEFFGKETRQVVDDEPQTNPVFVTQQSDSKRLQVETIRIGKENKNARQKTFNLTGKALNATSHEPIPNLVLSVVGKNINEVTDLDGNFNLDLPVGTNMVELKSLGMLSTTKKIIIYNNGQYNFYVEEDPEMLDEVLIDADKDTNVKETITGVSKIQVKDIKTIPLVLGERDILKVATTLPGITTAGEGASGYNVRGGRTDQNLMLLDNAVIYNPNHFFGIFSGLNPFTTGDVEIYKGNIPAQYGGRLSSVFEISTKEGSTNKFKGEGAIGPVTSNLTLEIPVVEDKSSLIVGGRATYSDWILKAIDDEKIKNSSASFYDAIINYRHQIDHKNSITTTGYYSKDKFSIASDSTFNYSNKLMSLTWHHRFNDKNRGRLILAHSGYDYGIDYQSIGNNNFNFDYNINETELKLHLKYITDSKHHIDYGISSKLYHNNPGKKIPKGQESIVVPTEINKEKALESGIFISDDYEFSKNFSVNAGLRYSHYAFLGETDQIVYADGLPKNEGTAIDTLHFGSNEVAKHYGGPEVRLSARYSFDPTFSVKASYNNNYQFIHTLTNNTTASPTDTWKLSDYNIKPQTAHQFSLGFYKNLEGNMYELSLEGYYKLSENLLDYKVGAELLLNQHIETEVLQGKGKAYGVEFLIKKTKGRLNGWLGYTYSRSLIQLDSEFSEERVNDGDFFPSNYDKPHDLSIVANYKLTKRYSFSANFVYQTGRPVTYPIGNHEYGDSNYVFYSDRNQFRIPDYYRLDLGINIEGNHKIKKLAHSFWNISVYNVLGRNNPYSVYFVTENGKVQAYQSSVFSVPVPTVTYNFRF